MNKEEAIEILKTFIDDYIIQTDEQMNKKILQAMDILLNHVHYVECEDCGKEIRTKYSNTKLCKECAKKRREKYNKKYQERYRERNKERKPILTVEERREKRKEYNHQYYMNVLKQKRQLKAGLKI